MIRTMLSGLFLFVCVSCFAQSTTIDTTLATYLKAKYYVQITDTVHFSKSIIPYYSNIMDFMTGDKLDMRNFYIPVAGVRDESYTLTIALSDLKSIRIMKAYEESITPEKYTYNNNGLTRILSISHKKTPPGKNPGGRDGELIINKLSGKVIFRLYE